MAKNKRITHWLLKAGIASGILFIGVSTLLALMVPGFQITRVPISVLQLGPFGWIQILNFYISGILAMLFAFGMWQLRLGKSIKVASILMGIYGLAIVVAGFNHPDPEFGFPSGSPIGMPTNQSVHAIIHGLAFFLLVIVLVASSAIFARRFAKLKEKGWMWYSLLTAISLVILLIAGISLSMSGQGGLFLFGVGFAMSLWISLIAKHLLKISKISK